MGWPTPKCGTDGGYQRHRRLKEDACEPCKEAHKAVIEKQRRDRGVPARKPGPEHGTRNAYARELYAYNNGNGPEPCAECRAANAEETRMRSTGKG